MSSALFDSPMASGGDTTQHPKILETTVRKTLISLSYLKLSEETWNHQKIDIARLVCKLDQNPEKTDF